MGINFEKARENMIKQQLRTTEINNDDVLEIIQSIPREDFVPSKYRSFAYSDVALPLEHQQQMMKPMVEGKMLQALNLNPKDNILEIGTGSGYITACLAKLGCHVTSIDLFESFLNESKNKLKKLNISNYELIQDDAATYAPRQHFDVVVVTGSVPTIPHQFKKWLNPNGRMFIITGNSPVMEANLIRKTVDASWSQKALFETDVLPLIQFEQKKTFTF